MNRKTILLLILVLLLGIAYWFISKKNWSTTLKQVDEFAIKDTGAVTKIFMASKNGYKILLERQPDNSWTFNNKGIADEPKVRMLLETLHDMQIQSPVAPSMHNGVIGILASRGIKTEIYEGDRLIKTIYVGSETPEKIGTYMLLEGSDQAYALHIPGFVGYLTPRFILDEIKWRSKFVFNEDDKSILSLKVNYPENQEASFIYDKETFQKQGAIQNLKGNLIKVDTQMVKFYLSGFKNLYVEGYYDEFTFTVHDRDSLLKMNPFCEIELKNTGNKTTLLTVYAKAIGRRSKQQFDENNKALKLDPEKYYALVNKYPAVASIQDYNFGRLFKKLSELTKK